MFEFALGAFVPAMLLSVLLTPLARRLAAWAGLVAPVRPDRLHRDPIPYGGGLAIAATLFTLAAVATLRTCCGSSECWSWLALVEHADFGDYALHPDSEILWVAVVSGVGMLFFVIGLVDDLYVMGALFKLAFQIAAASLIVLGGVAAVPVWMAWPSVPEWINQMVSVLWIAAVVNAYNMFDHADGLAAAVGMGALASMGVAQLALDGRFVPALSLATAGAIAGFLVYNFPPARVFLGDAGSMLVGYILAVLTVVGRQYREGYGTGKLRLFIPLALLAVPLFDMVCVVAARLWRRQNPMKGDATSHLAHRMLARGWSPRGIVAFAAGATAVTGAASASMYFLGGPALAATWLVVAAVLAAMLLVRRPPHAEAAR